MVIDIICFELKYQFTFFKWEYVKTENPNTLSLSEKGTKGVTNYLMICILGYFFFPFFLSFFCSCKNNEKIEHFFPQVNLGEIKYICDWISNWLHHNTWNRGSVYHSECGQLTVRSDLVARYWYKTYRERSCVDNSSKLSWSMISVTTDIASMEENNI